MRYEKTKDAINMAILTSNNIDDLDVIIDFINYFETYLDLNVSCVISNKDFNISNKLKKYKIPIYENVIFYKEIDRILIENNTHYIVLDSFLDKIPVNFCKKYQWKIINLHTALLPNFSGKGFYGDYVFKNLKKSNQTKTGISIYFVDSDYHTGKVIFDKRVEVKCDDSVLDIKNKTHSLTLKFYAKIVENVIRGTYKHLFK